jgi:hypothetical protein
MDGQDICHTWERWEIYTQFRFGNLKKRCNVKVNVEETGYEDMDWIRLAQDRVQWLVVVNVVRNLQVPWNMGMCDHLSDCQFCEEGCWSLGLEVCEIVKWLLLYSPLFVTDCCSDDIIFYFWFDLGACFSGHRYKLSLLPVLEPMICYRFHQIWGVRGRMYLIKPVLHHEFCFHKWNLCQ